MSADPKANNVLVETLGSSLRYGGSALKDTPALLRRTLEEEAWRSFVTRRGELVKHERFADFVTTPPTAGLGAEIDLVRRIVESDKPTLDLLDRVLQNPSGVHNINARPKGTSEAQALRRLRKDAPELHADVLAGRISAHGAMVDAGFRPRTVSVPVGRPDTVARTLRKHMTPDDLARLTALLAAEDA